MQSARMTPTNRQLGNDRESVCRKPESSAVRQSVDSKSESIDRCQLQLNAAYKKFHTSEQIIIASLIYQL